GGELLQGKLRPISPEPFRDQATRALEVESEIAAQKALRLQPAQQQVGIRHRGLGTAAVANRTGIGSGRFGSHAKGSAGIEARDGASPSAYSMYVEHRHADGEACNFGLAAGAGFAVNQRNIGGR